MLAEMSPKALEDELDGLCQKAGDLARRRALGTTVEGRPINVITLTDPAAAPADKQRVLVVAGEHANEQSGIVTLLGGMAALLKPENRAILEQQEVAFIPCANPDGHARNEGLNANGANLARAFPSDFSVVATAPESLEPETASMIRFLRERPPDILVNYHGGCLEDVRCRFPRRLGSGTINRQPFAMHFIDLARRIVEGSNKAGFPMAYRVHGDLDADPAHFTVMCVRNYRSFGWNFETSVDLYNKAELRRSGEAKLLALLQCGMERWPHHRHAGYPLDLIGAWGNVMLLAGGDTREERRRNRIALWSRGGPNAAIIEETVPMRRGRILGQVSLASGYRGKGVLWPEKFEVAALVPAGASVTGVRAAGVELRPDHDYVVQNVRGFDYVFIPVNDTRDVFGLDFFVCSPQKMPFEVAYDPE